MAFNSAEDNVACDFPIQDKEGSKQQYQHQSYYRISRSFFDRVIYNLETMFIRFKESPVNMIVIVIRLAAKTHKTGIDVGAQLSSREFFVEQLLSISEDSEVREASFFILVQACLLLPQLGNCSHFRFAL